MFILLQIEKLSVRSMRLSHTASKQLARAVFTMAKLRSLELTKMKFEDVFFSVASELAPSSQVNHMMLSNRIPMFNW